MALHGVIAVNGVTIGGWQATRTEPLREGRDEYVYDCQVDMYNFPTQRHTFQLSHHHSDGALVLASQVLWQTALRADE